MIDPRHRPWVVGKRILRCLCGTVSYGIMYASSGGVLLIGYTISERGGNSIDRKTTSRYCFSLVFSMILGSTRKKGSVS